MPKVKQNPRCAQGSRHAQTALAEYLASDEDQRTAVVDLLADLEHYCNAHDIDWAQALVMASIHASAEKEGMQ
jgi:hypothetical protein